MPLEAQYPPLTQRPIANTICLFDVDDTLSLPRTVSCHATQAFFTITARQP